MSNYSNISIDEAHPTSYNTRTSFGKYISNTHNKRLLLIAALIGITYFIILRMLYPIPSFYSDSFTWVGAAKRNQPVTFRPIGYSKFIQFFKIFSTSDIALIAGQFLSNLLANLFLFFTVCYFFTFKQSYKLILFVLLVANPLYLFYSNYVSSDAFFCSLTVLWFTLLIWIMHKPSWSIVLIHLIALGALFELRYNAIIYPYVSAIALLLTNERWMKKLVIIFLTFLLIACLILATIKATENYAGVRIFSAFSGWQMASNAMNILQHESVDSTSIKDNETRKVLNYVTPFFDTTTFVPGSASAWYMWHDYSPLKKYMKVYDSKSVYFKTWNELGHVYNNFGKTIILKHPLSYLKYFVLPNSKNYFLPPLEAYETYMEGRDTIAKIAVEYFKYKSAKTPRDHPLIYAIVFNPWRYIFPIINVLIIIPGLLYLWTKSYKANTALFNKTLVCFIALYIGNFLFVVLLAPTVFRYHVFILTLSFPVILYLMQSLLQMRFESGKHAA
jgi:4-amino-4-deoxy-L-arabinose transferase-like glycosyltransferase